MLLLFLYFISLEKNNDKVRLFSFFAYNPGPVTAILSWKIWTPLAKISYTAYLIHPFVIFSYNDIRKVHFHYDDITLVSN